MPAALGTGKPTDGRKIVAASNKSYSPASKADPKITEVIMESTEHTATTLLGDLAAWSHEKLPLWQQDALRRLREREELTENDLTELTLLCRQEAGDTDDAGQEIVACPLPADEEVSVEHARGNLALLALENGERVNALAANQSLTFSERGITVIYGDNGAGKSGYARVLRRACRARHRGEPIKPNVYAEKAGEPASMEIRYRLGEDEHFTQWVDGEPSPKELGAVSFFDSECATIHADEANSLAYTPLGLDLLPRLTVTCETIKSRLQEELRLLETQKPPSLSERRVAEDSPVSKLLEQIGEPESVNSLIRLSALSEDEMSRLKALPIELSQDPQEQASRLAERANRIERLCKLVRNAEARLGVSAANILCDAIETHSADAAAADAAAKSLFSDMPLDGVGSDTWRKLWQAAKRYSEQSAYPDGRFPVLGKNSRCVLCQQQLEDDGKQRLMRFSDFVSNDLRTAADNSLASIASQVVELTSISLRHATTHAALAEIASESADVAHSMRIAIIRLRMRRRSLIRSAKMLVWNQPVEVTQSTVDSCLAVVAQLRRRAKELKESIDPNKKALLQQELTRLEDRVWISTIGADLDKAAKIARRIQLLEKAICSTYTSKVTNKAKSLSDTHVTARLRDRFVEEVNRLDAGRLKVELSRVSAKKGYSRYQLQLVGAPSEQLGDVLSEGEQRCVALAGFLSELATENQMGPIVFDDPVSSLDHRWRNTVAKRLVDEGRVRQVVVFSHDLVFVNSIIDHAKLADVKYEHQFLSRSEVGLGTVRSHLPWRTQGFKDRINDLEQQCYRARRISNAGEDEAYNRAARDIYGCLRETIEQAIEDRLFNGAVVRWRDWIKVESIRKTSCIESEDLKFLEALHKTCCNWTPGHHASAGNNSSPPSAEAILEDVKALSDWAKELGKRQNVIG